MAQLQSVDLTQRPDADLTPGRASDALFEELVQQDFANEPSVDVAGDWVVRAQAARTALLEHEVGTRVTPNRLPQTGESLVTTLSAPDSLDVTTDAGDSTVTVGLGNGYHITNPGYSDSTTLYQDNNQVVTAQAGERKVRYGVPDADLAQLIAQFPEGYQFLALGALYNNLPSFGESAEWKVPSFNTASGDRALVGAYSYQGARVGLFPRAFARFNADVSVPTSTQTQVRILENTGEEVLSTDVSLDAGTTTVSVVALNVPSSGIVEYDTGNVAFSVANTGMFPPV